MAGVRSAICESVQLEDEFSSEIAATKQLKATKPARRRIWRMPRRQRAGDAGRVLPVPDLCKGSIAAWVRCQRSVGFLWKSGDWLPLNRWTRCTGRQQGSQCQARKNVYRSMH